MAEPNNPRALARQISWSMYSAVFVLLTYVGWTQDITLHYPGGYLVAEALAGGVSIAGLAIYIVGYRADWLRPAWRAAFPLMMGVLVIGITLDAVIPTDFNLRRNGWDWVLNLLLNVLLVAPGYWANWRLCARPPPHA